MRCRSIWAITLVAIVSISSSTASASTAEDLLNTLAVKGRAPKTGYTRAQFGNAWADVNKNGCDTRNDILKRDLTNIVFRVKTHDCVVESGTLLDPYSGTTINFVKGVTSSMEVQIDHVVALSNAWQTGAFKLTLEKRTALANDPDNLLDRKSTRLNSSHT